VSLPHAIRLARLVGIVSPSEVDQAYIHFVGVRPQDRKAGLARMLYQRFLLLARGHDHRVVRAITSPVNQGSIAFHQRLGFTARGPVPGYNGPGHDMVTFERLV
jgi:ribosomal protein S18 acetylase RimI-like enzyme